MRVRIPLVTLIFFSVLVVATLIWQSIFTAWLTSTWVAAPARSECHWVEVSDVHLTKVTVTIEHSGTITVSRGCGE